MATESFESLSSAEQEVILTRACPDYWLEKTTGEKAWARQVEVMQAVAMHPRVAVASGNGIGKTWLAARLAAWFLSVFSPATVVTTAPNMRQVKDLLWKEIQVVAGKAKENGHDLGGELFTASWEFPALKRRGIRHYGVGFASKEYDVNQFQGYHNSHILVIEDEAAGISEPVDEGINSILKGAFTRWLKIGNPTTLKGPFFGAFKSKDWVCYHISQFDTPNVNAVPPPRIFEQDLGTRKEIMERFLDSLLTMPISIDGVVTPANIKSDFYKWGEDHPLWQARVLGQFPDRTEDTFIAISWVERAAAATRNLEGATIDVGVDVARYGSANTVFVARIGDRPAQGNAFAWEKYGQQGLMVTCGRIIQFISKIRAFWKEVAPANLPCPLIRVKIDAVGLGAGAYDRCKEIFDGEEWRVDGRRTVTVHEMIEHRTARNPIQYTNATTEWWALTARGFEAGDISGEVFADKDLMDELVSRKYEYGSDGRMRAESKEAMKTRGEASPDFGDAVVIAYADIPMSLFDDEEPSSGLHAGLVYGR